MSSVATVDVLLFAATVVAFVLHKKGVSALKTSNLTPVSTDNTCSSSELRNSAFVFIKPHANTAATQKLVREKLESSGITILTEKDIDGETIDEKKLIDQHYYAIASKATILPAKEIPVPKDKFQENFGESWDTVLQEGRACNAMEACKRLECSAAELNEAWGKSPKVAKFGGGFYCGKVTLKDKELYVFNAFFMSMRSKFVGKDVSIHCYDVEWDPKKLSWADFRGKVLGPTDPAEAPVGSLRKTILDKYSELGLAEKPNKGDNGVHASASPFEGLAEKCNWLGKSIESESFGQALIDAGLSQQTIKDWSVDPRITMPDGSQGSVFDALEDMDVEECLSKLKEFNELNSNLI